MFLGYTVALHRVTALQAKHLQLGQAKNAACTGAAGAAGRSTVPLPVKKSPARKSEEMILCRGRVLQTVVGYVKQTRSESSLVQHEFHRDGQVAVLRLNDPTKMNALSVLMGTQLAETVGQLKAQPSLRAVILTGQGRAFCAGGDLKWLLERCSHNRQSNKSMMMNFYSHFLTLRSLDVPVIGAINGPAVGAGACLAIGGCDFRLAEPTASFTFNFVKIALHPGMGATYFLSQLVGSSMAAELLLTGRKVKADEAAQLKMVNKVCSDSMNEALKLADELITCGPVAVRACLDTLRRRQEMPNKGLTAALELEAEGQALTYGTEDFHEGVLAAMQKRPPLFKGK